LITWLPIVRLFSCRESFEITSNLTKTVGDTSSPLYFPPPLLLRRFFLDSKGDGGVPEELDRRSVVRRQALHPQRFDERLCPKPQEQAKGSTRRSSRTRLWRGVQLGLDASRSRRFRSTIRTGSFGRHGWSQLGSTNFQLVQWELGRISWR
jgi:hypothetical protein